MMMNSTRERTLAILFAGAVLVLFFQDAAESLFLSPFSDLQREILAARSTQSDLRAQADRVDNALRKLKAVQPESLPENPGRATVVYQTWLVNLLETCQMQSVIVTPSPPIAELAAGHRIPFAVQCSGSSSAIAMFLDTFQATPLLHRIVTLNITGSSDESGVNRMTLSIEALALISVGDLNEIPEPVPVDPQQSLFSVLSRDDIFRLRATPGAMQTDAPATVVEAARPVMQSPPAVASVDPRTSIRFIGSVSNGSQRKAWFVDQSSREEMTVAQNEKLCLSGIEARILTVQADCLQIDVAGQTKTLQIGQLLSEVSAD